ncbi:hypothetical protein CFC21_085274 [Triticum aestivum]|uniref:Uncharacterized protein n=2 Tax=Triticum aestivum TaxID=4565 RepID=A0A3B6NWI1_WHEAT|nr:uncharacterized protein LOC119318494 [Triticum dicoccoides]XP_044406958.1 uncharacterized protein LOC123131326 [Triticum aestivum]XP_048536801.1 uncharacterized protein LOC125515381 [Triticum urartu]XP_048536835.1 uncharacterized protein LOC125515411 [Triticum urartu]KAF7081320.1 hypothetical protein CFC21_085274 [Triticum aestivum]
MAISATSSLALHAAPSAARRRMRSVVASATRFDRRSAVLLLLSAAGAGSSLAAVAPSANAAGSIGLFGIRKKLERAEEAAREVGEAAVEAVEAGGEAVAEAGKEVAGEGMQLAAEAGLAGDALVQAGVVAGAEALGVLVGLSVVNGILKPEA